MSKASAKDYWENLGWEFFHYQHFIIIEHFGGKQVEGDDRQKRTPHITLVRGDARFTRCFLKKACHRNKTSEDPIFNFYFSFHDLCCTPWQTELQQTNFDLGIQYCGITEGGVRCLGLTNQN
jgi:hypothetical protein